MSQTSRNRPSAAPRVGPAGGVRWSPPLLPVNPLGLLDLVIHMLVPRSGEPHLCSLAEAAERAGMAAADMRRLWRALGFAEPDEDARSYTAADIAAFAEVARLVDDGVIDLDLALTMARPMGHLLSRLGAGQVSALSGLVGLDPAGESAPAQGDGQGEADALIPLLERLVVYAWRHHLTAPACPGES